MVTCAVKLRCTSGRVLYASVQLASIKLCDMAALFNCQLLSEVTQPSESHLNRCDNLSLQLIESGYDFVMTIGGKSCNKYGPCYAVPLQYGFGNHTGQKKIILNY